MRCYHAGLLAWASSVGADRVALGPNRLQGWHDAHQPAQQRLAEHPSYSQSGDPAVAYVVARATRRDLHLYVGARRTDEPSQCASHCTRGGQVAGIGFPVHAHMLRHATGFYLANAGQDTRAIQLYLGHKNIQHTVRYTELSPQRFKDFWKD